ncbi:hypothetical protein SDC9_112345 [bioreactor metagenome]|uniref:Uncharacterized protein n=1 Tax=bioreactor metagenome TaxID=1076179 RepID=A0A645BJ08_9ZZZZ
MQEAGGMEPNPRLEAVVLHKGEWEYEVPLQMIGIGFVGENGSVCIKCTWLRGGKNTFTGTELRNRDPKNLQACGCIALVIESFPYPSCCMDSSRL